MPVRLDPSPPRPDAGSTRGGDQRWGGCRAMASARDEFEQGVERVAAVSRAKWGST